jgi:hypothetical protein
MLVFLCSSCGANSWNLAAPPILSGVALERFLGRDCSAAPGRGDCYEQRKKITISR